MRFDLGGRGESRGNGLEARLATMAADLESAVEALRRNASVDGVILFGMCSGGNVAIGALPRIQGVQGLVMLSVYPFSDGDAFGRDVNRTLHFAAVYWRKLYRGETWKRFLRGDVDLGAVFNVLFGHFRKRRSKSAEPTPSTAPGATSQAVGDPSREGRKQVDPPKKHLQNLRSDLPGLLVYGTADPDASASMAYYGGYARENGIPLRIVQVEGATHNFASAIWTADVRTHVLRFCLELVGGAEHDHD
jgi:pimeloyl-ACP methyl ester carboxylesterase